MTLAPLPRLAPEDEQRGGSTALVADELKYQIMYAAANAPRSLQRRIGPSQMGTPCDRKLAYMLLADDDGPGRNQFVGNWTSILGTSIHAWLAEQFTMANAGQEPARWLVETTVEVGTVDGQPVTGHADLYDRVTAGVWDWKLVGASTIRAAKANGPRQSYRVQAHLYARGFTLRGLPVDYVGIAYLPRTGMDLNAGYFYTEPYDPDLAERAIQRADATAYAMRLAGADRLLPNLGTADDYCSSCPWFNPGLSQATGIGCPGHNRQPSTPPDASTILGA